MARRSLPAGCPEPGEMAGQSSEAADVWLLGANPLLSKIGIKNTIRTADNVEWSLFHGLVYVAPRLLSGI